MPDPSDFGDELPPDNKTVGSTGHVEDHNRLSRELAEVQAVVTDIVNAYPRIVGTVTQESNLPLVGAPGQHYLVGTGGELWGWDPISASWKSVGNIEGPQGVAGTAGTVMGILSNGDTPPPGTLTGTLWFEADGSAPAPDLTPVYVGGAANNGNTGNLTLTWPSAPLTPQAGDIAICAAICNNASDLLTIDAGWTLVTSSNHITGSVNTKLWTRTVQTGDSNVHVFNNGGASSTRMAASMMIFRNVTLSSGQPNGYTYGTDTTSAASSTAPKVTPSANSIVCGFWLEQFPGSTPVLATAMAVPTDFDGASPPYSFSTATTGSKVGSVAAGYDLTVSTGTSRPATGSTDDWVRTPTPGTATDKVMYTVALAKAT